MKITICHIEALAVEIVAYGSSPFPLKLAFVLSKRYFFSLFLSISSAAGDSAQLLSNE